MENRIRQLEHQCNILNFGEFALLYQEKALIADLDMVVVEMIKSLPESVQTDALLALTRHLRLPIHYNFNFFSGFYPPVWSILCLLPDSYSRESRLAPAEIKNYNTVHATAMLLHLLDDHLNDQALPATHLNLLIRSQLWVFLNRAIDMLVHADDRGGAIVRRFINSYYSTIVNRDGVESLDTYCAHFLDQMAMGYIAPVLMTKQLSADNEHMAAVQSCYGAFGLAWRLMDDLKDIQDDMETNTKSSVYYCLPEPDRKFWNVNHRASPEKKNILRIVNAILEHNIIDHIITRICCELNAGASIAEDMQMDRYADELRQMAQPLINQ